jgi:hypothetical protein
LSIEHGAILPETLRRSEREAIDRKMSGVKPPPLNLLNPSRHQADGAGQEVVAMFELFTAVFTVLFTLFAAAAVAGHVFLVQALLRTRPGRSESRGPSSQPATPGHMPVAVTGQ